MARCPANKYCEKDGLIDGVVCPNGYNCVLGTPIRGPNLISSVAMSAAVDLGGHLCDKGYFCDVANDATARQKKCPVGQFMPTEGAKVTADCLPCNGGHVCGPLEGIIIPTGCPSGHYCPGSTTTAVVSASASPVTAKQCTAGHSCPTNVNALYKC